MKTQYIRIDENGTKFWYSDKKMTVLHREDGPAVEWKDGTKNWFRDGLLHRDGGPAIQTQNGSTEWYRDGLLHREDGPAGEYTTGVKLWYINGVELTEAQFKAGTTPHNGKKVIVDGIEYTLQA